MPNTTPKETYEQIMLSLWLTKKGIRHTASANGGKRDLKTAMTLKRMGVSAGFPDIEIPYPSGDYHGLYLEMKRVKGGSLSISQKEWLEFLSGNGYYAVMVHGHEEGKEVVKSYFFLKGIILED